MKNDRIGKRLAILHSLNNPWLVERPGFKMKYNPISIIAKAMEMVELISAEAESTNPKLTWQRNRDALRMIYKLAHAARAPSCQKSHPSWLKPILDAMRAEKREKKKDEEEKK